MATLDDKILGEKLHYYCSSSEDEADDDDRNGDGGNHDKNNSSTMAIGSAVQQESQQATFIPEEKLKEWEGYSCNTGPKGVLKDWQRFKQLEAEKRESQETERLALMKKLTISCQTEADERKQRELDELLDVDDEFLSQYMQRRMHEMMAEKSGTNANQKLKFGQLYELSNGQQFLEAIDKTQKNVTVICHIYCRDIQACTAMNGCLRCLAEDFSHIKFVTIEASCAGMSKHFEKSGVPALLIYKNGNLLGNFVRLTDELGDDFFATDVETFLVSGGFLPDRSCVPEIIAGSTVIRSSATGASDSDDD